MSQYYAKIAASAVEYALTRAQFDLVDIIHFYKEKELSTTTQEKVDYLIYSLSKRVSKLQNTLDWLKEYEQN